jgi:hypothetical protein
MNCSRMKGNSIFFAFRHFQEIVGEAQMDFLLFSHVNFLLTFFSLVSLLRSWRKKSIFVVIVMNGNGKSEREREKMMRYV